MSTLRFLFLMLTLVLVPVAQATVPTTIDFQGFVRDSDGQPFIEENVILTTSLFNDITGGSAIWTEADTLDIDGGVFTTKLGDVEPLTLALFQDPTLFLEVSVDGNLSGSRTQLVSVPFALVSQLAQEAVHADSTDFATNAFHASYADSAGNGGGVGDGHWLAEGTSIHNTNPGTVIVEATEAQPKLELRGNGSVFRHTNNGVTLFELGTNSNASLLRMFGVDGVTPVFRVDGYNMNVGIGMNPGSGYALDVMGHIRSTNGRFITNGTATGTNKQLCFNGSGGSNFGTWTNPNDPNSHLAVLSGDDGVCFSTDWGDNSHLTVNSVGLGVGLSVDGNLAPIMPAITLGMKEPNTGFQWISAGTTAYYANGAERVRFFSNGDVNVGRNLNLAGRLQFNTDMPSPDAGFVGFGDGTGWRMHLGRYDGMKLVTFVDNGNVGVGTQNPTAKLHVVGDLCVTGQKNRIVETPFGTTKLNAVESAEAWFTKSGEGHLTNGRARINLSDHFRSTVTISQDYPLQVDVTFYGPHGNWYVERDRTGFTVIDSTGSNAEFSWRANGRQKGYEDWDLETVADQAGR